MEFGAVDYILKPLDYPLLINLINQANERLIRWRTSLSGTYEHTNSVYSPILHPVN